MSELENKQDLQPEVTPVDETTTPNDINQPEVGPIVEKTIVETVPDNKVLEEKLQESEALSKRYKEQLSGKDKLIESLRINKLAESLQPQASEPEDDYDDEVVKNEKPKAENFQTQLLVENTITNNEWKMEKKYANDPDVPWNEETKKEVYKELFKQDPSGKSLLRADAIELFYDKFRGQKLSAKSAESRAQADKLKSKEIELEKLKQKETRKAVAAVETSSEPSDENVVPSIEDIVSGKVKMSATDMVKNYPDMFGEQTKRILGIK